MKHNLYFIAVLCCLSTCSAAQSILTRDNCAPVAGTIYELQFPDASSLFPGSSGANVTWDFSSVTSTPLSITYSYEDISSSQFAGLYPSANLVRYSSGSPSQYFFSVENAGYEQSGSLVPDADNFYSDAIVKIPFPFTFGDEFIDTFHANGYNSEGNFTLDGTDTINADAYGTLLLSNGIILNDVLRIKTKMNSERVQTSGALLMESVTYAWYKPGIRDAVLEYTEVSYNGGPSSKSVAVQNISGILDIAEHRSLSTSVSPNPIQSVGKIVIETKGKKTACFFDVNGQKISEPVEFTESELQVNRNDFKAGIYFYTIVDETGSTAQGKIVFI